MSNIHYHYNKYFILYIIIICSIFSLTFQKKSSPLLRKPNQTTTTKESHQPQKKELQELSNQKYSTYAILTKCTSNNCAGECVTSRKCSCLPGYVTQIRDKIAKNDIYCSYKQKSQLIAFLLEAVLPFGVGHFYCERIMFGLSKMAIFFLPLISVISAFGGMICTDKCLQTGKSTVGFIAMFTVFITMSIVWWIADIITFGLNYYSDGNSIPLASWNTIISLVTNK